MSFRKIQQGFKSAILVMMVVAFSLVIGGCDANQVYNEHFETGEGFEWKKSDSKTFNVNIEDASVPYNVIITFRYATGYAKNTAPVLLVHATPDGETSENEYELKIRDTNGDYIGEPGYDIWDSDHLVMANISLPAGINVFTLSHNNKAATLMPVLDVGLKVVKVQAQ